MKVKSNITWGRFLTVFLTGSAVTYFCLVGVPPLSKHITKSSKASLPKFEECCPKGQSVNFTSQDPAFSMCLYPWDQDMHISNSVYRSGGNADVTFESPVRKWILETLAKHTDHNAVVLDIGANIGLHALFFGNAGYKTHVFEPVKSNFKLLQCSSGSNEVLAKNMVLNNVALGTVAGHTCISVQQGNFGSGQLGSGTQCDPENLVEVQRLDEYLIKHKIRPYLIKIDVEGFELKALKPAKELFKKHPPAFIYTEFAPGNLRGTGEDPAAYLDFFYDLGYSLHWWRHEKPVLKGDDKYKALVNGGLEDIHFYQPKAKL